MKVTRIVLVSKETPYEALLRTYSTHGQATFMLQMRGEDITSYLTEH